MKRLQKTMGLSNGQMAQLLHTSPQTIEDWILRGSGPLPAEQKRRLVRLDLIVALAARVYTKDKVGDFFASPLTGCDHKSATDLLLEGRFFSVVGAIAADYEKPDN